MDAWPVLALWLLCAAAPARAGLDGLFGGGNLVYDPANHAEMAAIAAESVKQTALQVRAEVQRLQQLTAELQQLKALPETTIRAVLADWRGQLGALQAAGQALAGLGTQLAQLRQQQTARLRQISSLGLSPETWLQQEVAIATVRRQSADTLFAADRQSMATIAQTAQALGRLQAQIPASSGVQQSLQTTNQYLDLLAGQTSQLLQLTAAQAAAQAGQHSAQQAEAAQAAQRISAGLTRDLGTIATLRSQLRSQEADQGWGILAPLP
jgi:hypothetical protein